MTSQRDLKQCVVLPVEKVVEVSVDDDTVHSLVAALERALDLPASTVTVMQKDCTGCLAEVEQVEAGPTIFALVRCRAGGKGGFRKQLEKKGREFARAQRAEERAKRRSASQTKKPVKGATEKQPTITTNASDSKDFVASMTTNANACRALAKQGVMLAVAKALGKSLP